MAWVIHKITGISYSVTVHAHDIFVRRTMLETKMRDASFIIAISEFNRDFLVRHLGRWIVEKTHVVHCGINAGLYAGAKTGQGRENRRLNLISVGGLRPYKCMLYLINACAILSERGVPFHCKIVGDGPEHAMLARQIVKLSVRGLVELVGPKTQREVADLLAGADCYIQPSVITPN
jgi:glycosyltransferase involved in cell wall biosynthesis